MSILETFYILFKSDASDVKKGANEADKAVNHLNEDLKKVDRTSEHVGASFLKTAESFASLIATGFVAHQLISGIQSAVSYGEELSKTSRLLQVNTGELQAWGNAVELAGGSASGFEHSLQALSEHFNTTSSISLRLLPKLADVFSRLNRVQALQYGRSLGLDEATILFLQQGRREVEAVIRTQKELGVITELDAENYRKLNRATLESEQAMKRLYSTLASEAAPSLIKFYNFLTKSFSYLTEHKDLVVGALIAIGGAAARIGFNFLKAHPAIRGAAYALTAFSLVYEDVKAFISGDKNSLTGAIINQFKLLDAQLETSSKKVQDFISKHFGEQFTIRYAKAKEVLDNPVGTQLAGQGVLSAQTLASHKSLVYNIDNIVVETQATNGQEVAQALSTWSSQLAQSNNYFDNGVEI